MLTSIKRGTCCPDELVVRGDRLCVCLLHFSRLPTFVFVLRTDSSYVQLLDFFAKRRTPSRPEKARRPRAGSSLTLRGPAQLYERDICKQGILRIERPLRSV